MVKKYPVYQFLNQELNSDATPRALIALDLDAKGDHISLSPQRRGQECESVEVEPRSRGKRVGNCEYLIIFDSMYSSPSFFFYSYSFSLTFIFNAIALFVVTYVTHITSTQHTSHRAKFRFDNGNTHTRQRYSDRVSGIRSGCESRI